MTRGSALVLGGALLTLCIGGGAAAQDAAELAAILSGSAQTGGAQKSLGNSIRRSINSASVAIPARPPARSSRTTRQRNRGAVQVGGRLPAGVDPLEGSDATQYRLGNGVGITTSGRINTVGETKCVKDCPKPGGQ
ncbi:hypothetical protein [Croceicoccus naphthovorans]|uniref:Uncharacterized protein n=1 Tax=Croceicoccus naphthovorans TaxID=1348774 RepID=A0A0G3XHF7_9SPHN|nr:hypothetical protein [Croceicoccus naphthovorans]AKM11005.1 hypothetical protein AB433_15160 [Croceicoccus naphthovorans]MBB3989579.1 hypothetical protein [Croceicoccus naphthovorans]